MSTYWWYQQFIVILKMCSRRNRMPQMVRVCGRCIEFCVCFLLPRLFFVTDFSWMKVLVSKSFNFKRENNAILSVHQNISIFILNYRRDCAFHVLIAYYRNCRCAIAPCIVWNETTNTASEFFVPSPNAGRMNFHCKWVSCVQDCLLLSVFSADDYARSHCLL